MNGGKAFGGGKDGAYAQSKGMFARPLNWMAGALRDAAGKRGGMSRLAALVGAVALVGGALLAAAASFWGTNTFQVLGPVTVERGTGQPVSRSFTFSVIDPSAVYELKVYNGGSGYPGPQGTRVSSAKLVLNGQEIFGTNDFNQNVGSLSETVKLQSDNQLEVILNGKPGGFLVVEVIGYDDVAPTITAAIEPNPNPAGWNNTSVVVRFSCSDKTAGIETCPPPVPVEQEIEGLEVSGTAVDRAGNEASVSVTVNVDKTASVISPTIEPAPNAAGWNRMDTTVSFACTDNLSGVAACSEPVTVTAEGAGQAVTGQARDVADNASSAQVTINLDKTAPDIAAAVVPAANANGWHNTDPTVSFTCADTLSGIVSCPAPVTLSSEGASQTISGTASDAADNATATSVTLNLDKSAPIITAAIEPAPNAAAWNKSSVIVRFTCSDSISGIETCSAPVPVELEGKDQVINGTAMDRAGNQASTSITVNIDKTSATISPAIEPVPNPAGWNNTDALVRFTCADNLSGVAECTAPVTVATEGAAQTVTGQARDVADNLSSAEVVLNIDKTRPLITVTPAPTANGRGWHHEDITLNFACDDPLSGIALCPPSKVVSTEGAAQNHAGTAVDGAGNEASTSIVLNLDKTAPVISAAVAPAANANHWHNADPTVSFTCTDALSGIASCSDAVTVHTESAAQTVSGSAVDAADNAADTSVIINLDKTMPTMTAAVAPAANAKGWHNTDPRVSFTCADTLSGIVNCPVPVTLSAEGTNQTISGSTSDKADNAASTSVVLSLDKTAPVISAAVAPAANANHWHNTDPTVSFTCTDALSGIASCPDAVTVNTESAAQIESGSAVDTADNAADTSVTINLDKTVPTITAAVAPAANANGWHKADAKVSFTCADTLSGIVSCPAPVTVSAEGPDQTVSGSTSDKASNSASTSVVLHLDKTAPIITAAIEPVPNVAGWNKSGVIVRFTCTDAGSGIETCPAPVALEQAGKGQVVNGTAVDRAGNTAAVTVTVNIDTTNPLITVVPEPAPNAAGWHKADVNLNYECSDALSGVAQCPQDAVVSGEGASQPFSGTAVDAAGNSATASITLSVDKTAPAISAAVAPAANANGWYNADPTVSFTCTDGLSGIASCPQPVTLGSEGAGQKVSGTAVDAAGNTAAASVTLNLDKTSPSAAFVFPQHNGVVTQNPPEVVLGLSDNLGIDPNRVVIQVNGEPVAAQCQVSNTQAKCTLPSTIPGQGASLAANIADLAGNAASASVTFAFDNDGDGVIDVNDVFPFDPKESADLDGDGTGDNGDTDRDGDGYTNEEEIAAGHDPNDSADYPDRVPPQLTLNGPAEQLTEADSIDLSGGVTDAGSGLASVTATSDRFPGISFAAITQGDQWQSNVPLEIGTNRIVFTATDQAGNAARVNVVVERENPNSQIGLTIDYPLSNTALTTPELVVRGQLRSDKPALQMRVLVNGTPAQLTATEQVTLHRFQSSLLTMVKGANTIYIQGDVDGQTVQRSLTVFYQPEEETLLPPQIEILAPLNGSNLSESSFFLAGRVTSEAGLASLTINGASVAFSGSQPPDYSFRELVNFSSGQENLSVTVTARDAQGRTTTLQAAYVRDATAPAITLEQPLLAPPQENLVTEKPYPLRGTISETHLAAFLINDTPVGVSPAGEGQYQFDLPLALTGGAQTLRLAAVDQAGNRSEQEFVLRLDSATTISLVAPEDGTEYTHRGEPIPVQVTARVAGEISGGSVRATLLNGGQVVSETELTGSASLRAGSITLPAADGEYSLRATVLDAAQQTVAATASRLRVTAAETIPVAVTRLDPSADQTGVEPNTFITVYFNQSIDLTKLKLTVNETAFGQTYVDVDPLGAEGIMAKGYQLQEVNRSHEPVPGSLSLLPNSQVVAFYPARDLAYNGEVYVAVEYDGMALQRIRFQTRPLPTFVTGTVMDQFKQPVAGVEVALAELGRTVTTNRDGAFAFGFGDRAEETLPGGRFDLSVNTGRKNPQYGTQNMWVNVQANRRNTVDAVTLPVLNREVAFVPAAGRSDLNLLQGALKIDLRNADLEFPDGQRQGDIHAQFMTFTQLPYPIEPIALPHWMYVVQPAGVKVEGAIAIDLGVPMLNHGYDHLPPEGSYVVLLGLDGESRHIAPMGVGRVQNQRIVSVGQLHYDTLDAIGYALTPETVQPLLAQYAQGEIDRRALLSGLTEAMR